MASWFQENAPKSSTKPPGGSWFAENAPESSSPDEFQLPAIPRPELPKKLQPIDQRSWSDQANLKNPIARGVTDVAEGAKAGLSSTILHGGDLVRRITGTERVIDTPEAQRSMRAPNSIPGKAGKFVEQAAEFAIPASKAATLTKGASLATRAAAQGGASGLVSAVQSGGDPAETAISTGMGAAGPLVGSVARKGAEAIAGKAMGLRPVDRAYGKTVAAALLDETNGFTPNAVKRSAQKAVDRLTPELEAKVTASSQFGSLKTARDILEAEIAKATKQSSKPMVEALQPMLDRINSTITGAPRHNYQLPEKMLDLKRGFQDFTQWKPGTDKKVAKIANRVYHALDAEIDKSVPESAGLNQRLSSLIAGRDRAASRSLNAGLAERSLGRFAAHSGALAGALYGFHAGGVPGAIAGIVGPEMVASPTAQMVAARGINAASKRWPSWLTAPMTVPAYKATK